MSRITHIRNEYQKQLGQKNHIEKQLDKGKQTLRQDKRNLKVGKKAKDIVNLIALRTQSQLEYKISSTVEAAQEAVFENPYKFSVEFEKCRDQSECKMHFKQDDQLRDPLGSSGYGAVDVAAFALRAACWSMSRTTRPLLLLDEPFKHLKGEKENQRAIAMVKEVSKQLGLQIIMISDERAPREDIIEGADKVFEICQNLDGRSHIDIIENEKREE